MNTISFIAGIVAEITIPPGLVAVWTGRIVRSNENAKRKTYELNKAVLVGALLSAAIYIPILMQIGAINHLMGLLGNTAMPLLLQAVVFALVLVAPLLLSISVILLIAFSAGGKIAGKETGVSTIVKGVLKFILLILGPIIGFGLVWWALILYLPQSLTSRWWFDLVMYALLVLLAFVLYPEVKVRIGKRKELPPELKEELLRFCRKNGVEVRDIVVRDNRRVANAMVTGLLPGRKYIILTSALVDNFERDELMAVVAHELGHVRGKHLWINAALTAGWFLFWVLLVHIVSRADSSLFNGPAGFFALLLFAVLVWDYGFGAKIAMRNEFKADEFAARTVGADAAIRALEKLSEMGPYPRRTGRWFRAITYHPSADERIEHLMRLREAGAFGEGIHVSPKAEQTNCRSGTKY